MDYQDVYLNYLIVKMINKQYFTVYFKSSPIELTNPKIDTREKIGGGWNKRKNHSNRI